MPLRRANPSLLTSSRPYLGGIIIPFAEDLDRSTTTRLPARGTRTKGKHRATLRGCRATPRSRSATTATCTSSIRGGDGEAGVDGSARAPASCPGILRRRRLRATWWHTARVCEAHGGRREELRLSDHQRRDEHKGEDSPATLVAIQKY